MNDYSSVSFFLFLFILLLEETLITLRFSDFVLFTKEIGKLCQIGTEMSSNCQFVTLSKSVVINYLVFNLDLQSAKTLQIATVPAGK